MMKIYSEHKVD